MDRLRLNAEFAPLLRFPTMRWRRAVRSPARRQSGDTQAFKRSPRSSAIEYPPKSLVADSGVSGLRRPTATGRYIWYQHRQLRRCSLSDLKARYQGLTGALLLLIVGFAAILEFTITHH
jgi:hypothetical protein